MWQCSTSDINNQCLIKQKKTQVGKTDCFAPFPFITLVGGRENGQRGYHKVSPCQRHAGPCTHMWAHSLTHLSWNYTSTITWPETGLGSPSFLPPILTLQVPSLACDTHKWGRVRVGCWPWCPLLSLLPRPSRLQDKWLPPAKAEQSAVKNVVN